MCLSERKSRTRSRTVCDHWAQVGNVGFAVERYDTEFYGGKAGGSGLSN